MSQLISSGQDLASGRGPHGLVMLKVDGKDRTRLTEASPHLGTMSFKEEWRAEARGRALWLPSLRRKAGTKPMNRDFSQKPDQRRVGGEHPDGLQRRVTATKPPTAEPSPSQLRVLGTGG